MNIDESKTIEYDNLPKGISEFLSLSHEHNNKGEIVYLERDVLILIANLIDK